MLVSPADHFAGVHARGESDVAICGWINAAAGGEDLRGHLHRLGEVAGDAGERGDEEVAEAVALKVALREAVLEEPGQQELVLRECDHAVAHVSGRQDVQVFAQAAGGASVVGDGDHGGEVVDEAGKQQVGGFGAAVDEGLSGECRVGHRLGRGGDTGGRVGGAPRGDGGGDVALESAEQGGKAGTSADGDHAECAGGGRRGCSLGGLDRGGHRAEHSVTGMTGRRRPVLAAYRLARRAPSDLGVEEFGEAGVVGHILEVGVGAGLDTVFGVEPDRLSEVLETGVGLSGHAGEDGETIEGVVGLFVFGDDLLELGARVLVVAFVEQGDGVVVAFLQGGELGFVFGALLEAGIDVHADALGKVGRAGGEHVVEGGVRLVEFALLHQAQGGFVLSEGAGAGAVDGCGRGPGEGAGTLAWGRSSGLHGVAFLCGSG